MKCPICGYHEYRYVHYTEEWGEVEQHGLCERCGYTIEQAYSEPVDGFVPMTKRGYVIEKSVPGTKRTIMVYVNKNTRKRKHAKHKYGIKYGNKDYMLCFI